MTLKSSFLPIVSADTRVLLLGSLPGERSLAERRYYAHPRNQFWALMSPVVGRDLVSLGYDERLAALLGAGVGLWDVVATARRTGSSDAAIRGMTGNDLASLAASLPPLRAIGFNGAIAHRHGLRQLGASALRYALVPLPSSSPLHTIGVRAKAEAWGALRAFL